MADGFLGRWSRRKLDGREGKPLDEPVPERPALAARAASVAGATPPVVPAPPPLADSPDLQPAETKAPPSLDDVRSLTPESDFTPFVARSVAPEVRNAAMKKLFADPHFNVMDRLDIYIDDYSKSDPIPESMLRQMVSGKFLKLFADEENTPAVQSVAKSTDGLPGPTENKLPPEASPTSGSGPADQANPPVNPEDHANTDLRLQQNHAAGAALAEREPECRPRHGTS